MRSFSLRTFYLFSTQTSISQSSFSSSSPALLLQFSQFSTYSNYSPYHSSSSSRRQEEESRNVRVSVWWDFENCNLPAAVNVFKVAHLITAAVRANGIKGPVQITAFGDVLQLSRANQEALSSTGINLTHVPQGGKNSADRSLLVDLMYWVSQNPPPAHLFLISGDRDFASILHRLRMSNYNILLASPESAPGVLCSAASIMWHWHALIRGENLNGKCFNLPPDGRYGSWYGHYKVPLEDPFTVIEQPSYSRTEEISEPVSDSKFRPIPKAVMKHIRSLLKVYPKGISITEFRAELGKGNVCIDKDLYGYKKFSRFLLAMPNILKLQSDGHSQFIVHGVNSTTPNSFESSRSTSSQTITSDHDVNVASKSTGRSGSLVGAVDEASSLSTELNAEGHQKDVQNPSQSGRSISAVLEGRSSPSSVPERNIKEASKPLPLVGEAVNAHSGQETTSNLHHIMEQDSASEMGFLKRIWRKCFGSNESNDSCCVNRSRNVTEKSDVSSDTSDKESHKILGTHASCETHGENTSQDASSVKPVSSVSPMKGKTATILKEYDGDNSDTNPGLLHLFGKWLRFWESDEQSIKLSDQSFEQPDEIKGGSGKHQLLSESSFWNDLESFLETPKASVVISQSKTREDLARNLQLEGPSVLKSRSKALLLDMVDLLISEKKWVEECLSKTTPFKLTLSVGKEACANSYRGSNGLRSIFMNTSPEQDAENKDHQTGVSPPGTNKSPDRSRSEILGDCQKLVNEITKEYPEGYNMGSFRKLFLERYRYNLDLQKLGYQKLASLLQIIPGVKIESTYIVPYNKSPKISSIHPLSMVQGKEADHALANSDSESLDSPWDELGPLANNDIEPLSRGKAVKATKIQPHVEYESLLSEDDFTDSEGDSPPFTGQEEQGKRNRDKEDSSLLQILDSWYSHKEGGDCRKPESRNAEEMIDCSANSLKPSCSFGDAHKNETNARSYGKKQRLQRSYSFVLDQDRNDKEKLIDGILGSLKKSGESSLQG